MSEAHQHMNVFMYLDDTIIQHIELSEDPRLKEAQSYIRMLKLRQLYHVETMAQDPVELTPSSGRFQWKRRIQTPDEAMPGTVLYHNDNGDIVQRYMEFRFILNYQPYNWFFFFSIPGIKTVFSIMLYFVRLRR